MTHPVSLEELEKIAKEATPGPWTTEVSVRSNGAYDVHWSIKTVDKQPEHPWSPRYIAWMTGTLRSDVRLSDLKGAKYCRECGTWHLGWREVGVDVRADDKAAADATFDPPTVISLLEALNTARAERDEARKDVAQFTTCMCGDQINDHYGDEGHSPISVAEYYYNQQRERAEAAEAALSRSKADVAELVEGLKEIESVAPHLPDVHRWLDQKDAEDVFDLGFRHKNGKKPYDYLIGWLGMLRPFAYATRDDSWGELEKLICIVMRNYVRVAAATDRARALLDKHKPEEEAGE